MTDVACTLKLLVTERITRIIPPSPPLTCSGNVPFLRSEAEVKRILDDYNHHLLERTAHHLGYPYNLQFRAGSLKPFLEYVFIR